MRSPNPPSFQRSPYRVPVPEDLPTVGSFFQRRSLVEPLEEDQSLSGFLISRGSKEPINVVHAEVTDDLSTAIIDIRTQR